MTLAINIKRQGSIREFLRADRDAFAVSAPKTVRKFTTRLEKRMKTNVRNRLGTPMSRSTRSDTFPRQGGAYNPRGQVWFESTRQTAQGPVDIIDVFRQGATIRSRNAQLLWVPTDEGRRLGGAPKNRPRSLTPQTFRGGELLYLPIRGASRNARVVARLVLRNNPNVTVFVGLRRVRLRRRLRLDSIYNSVLRNIQADFEKGWERERTRRARSAQRGTVSRSPRSR